MKIRDFTAARAGNISTADIGPGGLEIMADDGKALFTIRLKDGILTIYSVSETVRHGGIKFMPGLVVDRISENSVEIRSLIESSLNRSKWAR
jgi:hypothetical protein